MKIRMTLILLCTLAVAAVNAQTVLIPDRWRFTTGDDPKYKDIGFYDENWAEVDVPSNWEKQGFDGYDGIAWYRVHFDVGQGLVGKELRLVLGKVDDADETYLNGVRIGAMGKFPPDSVTAYTELRLYRVPAGLLKEHNVLAVRVYDMTGPGGIVFGPIGLYNESDYQKWFNPPPGPKKSFSQLVTSNGLIAAVYDEKRGMIEAAYPHIFQAYDSSVFVQAFIRRIAPNAGRPPVRVFYRGNSHVIATTYPGFEIDYFAPFTKGERILYAIVSGTRQNVEKCSFSYEGKPAHLIVDSLLLDPTGRKPRKVFLFGSVDSAAQDTAAFRKAITRLRNFHGDLVRDETVFMQGVVRRCRIPHGLRPQELALLEQSVAVLKMAQVSDRERFPRASGQILASLPPGMWNIAWVRDGMYSVLALTRLGLFPEAKSALQFMLDADVGHYVHYRHTDGQEYGVGVPYKISVCRYFGIGKEESDFSDAGGPNIELDGFGLFLTAYADYMTRSGDGTFFEKTLSLVSHQVADVIIHCTAENDLIRADSGPWERHLPGKQFASTSIVCAAGLRDFAALCERKETGMPDVYRKASERLQQGIRKNLMPDGKLIKGNVAAVDSAAYDYFDGGTIEAFALDLFPDSAVFASHMAAYERALRMAGERRGFSRINKGDWYETAEWILLDLRTASAFQSFGEKEKARALLDWVTDQGALNNNLLPELFAEKTAFYDGAIPMVGFGAGAYILAVTDLSH